jgi:predicted secreted protein
VRSTEFFAAGPEDVDTIMSGRRRPIAQGQVGIRCRHCAHLPLKHRKKAAIYYPARLKGIYQAAQNMNVSHLAESCMNVDNSIRTALVAFQQKKGTTGHGGKDYWSQTATAQGVYEIEGEGLRFVGTDTVPNANFQAL